MTWASAADIKGIENRFVCVIDIDSVDHGGRTRPAVRRAQPASGRTLGRHSPTVKDQLNVLFKAAPTWRHGAYKKAAL